MNAYLWESLRFFCNTKFCYLKYLLEWVYLILFEVYCQALNLCICMKYRFGLANMVPTCTVTLLITAASHILSITSSSPWGFFWGTWVQRSKKEVSLFFPFFFFFWHIAMQLSNLQAVEMEAQIHWQKASGWIALSWVVNLAFSGV